MVFSKKLYGGSMKQKNLAACILFYEKADQTIECIDSIINTSEINIYVLNNNSSQKSRERLNKYCQNYSRIKVYDSSTNLGVGVGRNYLINHTEEEWLFFIDNDITIKTKNWLDILSNKMKEYQEGQIEAYIPYLFNIHDGAYVRYHAIKLDQNIVNPIPVEGCQTNFFPGGASVIHRKVFDRLGLYDEKMFVGFEDYELAIRGLLSNHPIKALFVPEIELLHDHRKAVIEDDKSAVTVRYNTDLLKSAFDRIGEKHRITLNLSWDFWAKKQLKKFNHGEESYKIASDFAIQFLSSIIKKYSLEGKKIAIWGSGELGEALFNNCEPLQNSLATIVDGSVGKQGKMFVESGLEIKSPEYLVSNPVDVIVIASVYFMDQIINIIADNYMLSAEIICAKGIFANAKEAQKNEGIIVTASPTYKKRAMKTESPKTCTLYLTDRCNFKCVGCSRQSMGISKFNEMNLSTVKKFLELYPETKSFCIAGFGEPTLNSHFKEIVEFLLENHKYVGVITNGSCVGPLLDLTQEPNYISISLYGINNEMYHSYCGVPIFDLVIENFKLLKERFFNVGFSYIVNKTNYQDLKSVVTLCDKLNPNFINLVNYLAYDINRIEEIEKIITINDSDVIHYIDRVTQNKPYIHIKPCYIDPDSNVFYCNSYQEVINLDGNGNIGGCQRQLGPDESYGNINRDSDPFQSGKLKELRNHIQCGNFPHNQCKYCFGRFM